MSHWILILFLYPGHTDANAVVTTIPFASEQECKNAGIAIAALDWGKTGFGGYWFETKFVCVQQTIK